MGVERNSVREMGRFLEGVREDSRGESRWGEIQGGEGKGGGA